MNFLKVLWNDIDLILKNKITRVSVIAITLIPLIYGGLYLAAFWDPYGSTSKLPIAVVNLDKGGISNNKSVNYGDGIVDNLKYNHDLGWDFVSSEQEAEKGLKGDKYYAMIVVPKDFSTELVNVDKGKVQKPQLIYISNKKKNYVVGLITDKASKALQTTVSTGIVGNFTEGVFDNMYELRDGMESAANGSTQIRDGVQQLRDKIPALSDGVNKLYEGSSTLNSKLLDASNGSNKLRDGTGTLKDKMPDLVDGVNKINDGSTSLNKHIGDALKGSYDIKDGVASLNDKIPSMSDGVDKLYDGSNQLKDGLGEVNSNMPELVSGVSDLNSGARQLNVGLSSAMIGSANLANGIGQLQAGAQQMQTGITTSIVTSITQQPSPTKLQQLIGGASAVYDGMQSVFNSVPDGAPFKVGLQKDIVTIGGFNDTLNSLSKAITDSNSSSINDNLLAIGNILNAGSLDIVSKDLGAITVIPPTLKGGVDTIISGLSSLKSPLSLLQGLSQLATGAGQLKTQGADVLTSGINQLYYGSTSLDVGLEKLNDSTGDLANGMDTLYNGSRNLNGGLSKFKSSIPDLKDGVNQLSDGTKDLSDGLYKINSGSGSLTEGIGKLKNKIPDLQDGVNQLNTGTVDLSDGVLKLYNGSGDLRNGIEKLNNKIPDLQSGTEKLYEGEAQLNDKLKEGASKLSDKLKVPSKEMSSFMTNPVELKEKPLYDIKKYGAGLTPYFISLALWVGALMMFFVITDEVEVGVEASPAALVLGKYLSYSALGVIQAVLISIAVIILGLKPPNIPLYIAFNIFVSFVFIAIMQNLVFLLGMVGRLIAIIVLLLQLTSSNGTFPKELLPKFFQEVGPFMPFTYTISALREINNGADYNVLFKDIAILSIMLVVFLTCSVLLKGHSDKIKTRIKLKNDLAQLSQQTLKV